jgi:hypothetical protein
MAQLMKLTIPYDGMPFIYNISQKVGVFKENPNLNQDVELVQFLLSKRIAVAPYKKLKSFPAPAVTGALDAGTVVQMFLASDFEEPAKYAAEISPARDGKVKYDGVHYWTIAYLNWKLFKVDKATWENLPNLVSPALKAQLAGPIMR